MKIKLILGLLVISLFLISGCETRQSEQPTSLNQLTNTEPTSQPQPQIVETTKSIQECQNMLDPKDSSNIYKMQECTNDFIYNEAKNRDYKSITECQEIEDTQENKEKSICYISFAIKTEDPHICDELVLYEKEEQCNPAFIFLAKRNKDLSICDKMDNTASYKSQSNCYCSITSEISDPELCKKCPEGPNGCISSIARESNDEKICDLIPIEVKSFSRDLCYLNVAMRKNDINVCNGLPNDKRIICFVSFQQHKNIKIDYSGLIGNKYVEVLQDSFEISQNAIEEGEEATLVINNIGKEDITVFATTELSSPQGHDTSNIRCTFGFTDTKSKDYTIKSGEGITLIIHIRIGRSGVGKYECKVSVPLIQDQNNFDTFFINVIK